MSLDILENHILVSYPQDPNIRWHHRILLFKIESSTWIVVTPDGSIQVLNVAEPSIPALGRSSPMPNVDGGIYAFDPLGPGEFEAYRREGRGMAEVMGATVPASAGGVPPDALWRFADTGA
jgi:hypothetical protein